MERILRIEQEIKEKNEIFLQKMKVWLDVNKQEIIRMKELNQQVDETPLNEELAVTTGQREKSISDMLEKLKQQFETIDTENTLCARTEQLEKEKTAKIQLQLKLNGLQKNKKAALALKTTTSVMFTLREKSDVEGFVNGDEVRMFKFGPHDGEEEIEAGIWKTMEESNREDYNNLLKKLRV